MAEKGKIYWVLEPMIEPHSGKYELYIGGEPFTLWDQYTGTLWNQNSSATIPWSSKMSSIFQVNLINDVNANNYAGWFKNATSLTVVTNQGYYSSDIAAFCNGNSYKEMFYGCSALAMDNTYSHRGMFKPGPEAVDASYMFYGCTSMREDGWYIGGLENAVITNASHMFQNCSESYNVISYASDIFYALPYLEDWSVSKAKLTDISYMFAGCREAGNIEYINEFDLSNTTNMSHLFDGCEYPSSYEPRQFSSFANTKKVTDVSYMFHNCTSIQYIDMSGFNTDNLANTSYMFNGCALLESVDLGGWDASNITNSTSMFDGCSKLETVAVKIGSDWTGAKLASSGNMFRGCTSIVGENGTRYSSSAVNKTRAVVDSSEKIGYFKVSKRRLTKNIDGNGQIICDEEYPYGATVTIQFIPDENYYIEYAYVNYRGIIDNWNHNNGTASKYTYSFTILESSPVGAEFKYRNEYRVTVMQEGAQYPITGAGTYRYLDNVILVADLNEGAIVFLGWYIQNTQLSNQNPFSFSMPDRDYIVTAKFGDPPFTDENVRQFVLINANNEIYKLTNKESPIFFNKPTGLGYSKQLSTVRYGNSEDVQAEQFDMPKPKGSLYFYNSDIEKVYKDYNNFVRFSMRKPFMLWYKLPLSGDNNTYHLPVEITSLDKTETNELGALESGIEFYGLSFWKQTQISNNPETDRTFFNDGDLDAGVEITASKGDSTIFTNPVITFSIDGVENSEYGLIAFEGTFTKIYINSNDKDQKIILWNGSEEPLDNPFTYLNFQHEKIDGTRTFPYPKLKNGKITRINFSYDGYNGEETNVLVVYDKEYVSV